MTQPTALDIVGDTYQYPNHAWESRYQAAAGKRKLLRILYYLRTGRRQRHERPKNLLDRPITP